MFACVIPAVLCDGMVLHQPAGEEVNTYVVLTLLFQVIEAHY